MPRVTGHIAFNGNRYSDGGEVQFYSTNIGNQAIGNFFERTGGLSAWGRGAQIEVKGPDEVWQCRKQPHNQ